MRNGTHAAGQPSETYAARSFIIVARDQRELWQALVGEFKHIPEIRVFLDRRQAERRRNVVPVVVERRGAQRRSLLRLQDDLHARQYVLVRPRHHGPSD